MSSALQNAVLRTILYADVFNYPLTPAEIHHYLIDTTAASADGVAAAIDTLVADGPLMEHEGYICLARRPELVELRQQRDRISESLLPVAERYGRWLARLPFVRLVALTGALSMRNAAAADEDLDYLIVTTQGRVWLARAFSILLVRLVRLRGTVLCPNYVLAETALEQTRDDLFVAHELAQMLPLYGELMYWRMRAANPWTDQFLPNADRPFQSVQSEDTLGWWGWPKRAAEWLLSGRAGDALENWEQRRKVRRFAADMQTPHHDARLDGDHVKGHFNDHGHRVLNAYAERLQAYCCADETTPTAPT